MKKKKIGIGLLILIVLIAIGLGYISQKGVIPFETVDKAGGVRLDAPMSPLYAVVTNEDELNQFLDKFGSVGRKVLREAINFSEDEFKDYILIFAYFGRAPAIGYEIEIKKIVQEKDIIRITVQTKEPNFGLEKVTHPYHVVKVKKDDLMQKDNLTFIFEDIDRKELFRMGPYDIK